MDVGNYIYFVISVFRVYTLKIKDSIEVNLDLKENDFAIKNFPSILILSLTWLNCSIIWIIIFIKTAYDSLISTLG
ncbi:unnamed protein product [Blepharisma stoltei]|uniref:Uncharacterized protein n=1 Tax=Blepharisma stoltei TaxID=1481888 RepID=A0AAU9K0X1_9CILI|nr:unnamed protein product [Blepharisma stoltei]